MVERKDLTDEEWHWLERIHKHNAQLLTVTMDNRLKELGLVQQALGGSVVSPLGKRIVEQHYLPIIRRRREEEANQRSEAAARNERERLMRQRRGL